MKTHSLALAAQAVLQQGLDLLADCSPGDFARVAPEPFGASIGQHYRHVLDHFLCLASASSSGIANYDERSRDRKVETEIKQARAQTELLIRYFGSLVSRDFHRECVTTYSVGDSASAPETTLSTLGREMAYCISHAVHHFALIKILCAQLELPVAAEFGVAPSTLKHRAARMSN
jgi:hypothetical protein